MGLNQRITIIARSAGADALGQLVETWADLVSLWADVRYASGAESIKADALTGVVKASVRIRLRSDITAAMRVRVGAQLLEIKVVLPELRGRQYMDLVCEGVQS